MEILPDAASLATKLKNTLIQYYNIEDSEWRPAKKTVSDLVFLYVIGLIFFILTLVLFFFLPNLFFTCSKIMAGYAFDTFTHSAFG